MIPKMLWVACCGLLLWSCKPSQIHEEIVTELMSPNGQLKLEANVDTKGQAFYRVLYKNEVVIDSSKMSFELEDAAPLKTGFQIVSTHISTVDETWEQPWGEDQKVRNHHNQLMLKLRESGEKPRELHIVFRLFDDGVGFRYEFPEQPHLKEVLIADEYTEFNLTEDYKTFWQPGDWDTYEHLYQETALSTINATTLRDHPNVASTYIPHNAVNTPVTMVGKDGLHLSFHEAALVDYAGMTLAVDTTNYDLTSKLVGSANTTYKVKRELPFHTPWRSIQMTDNAADLIASHLILNLNEPNKLGDVSWFKPMKYTGVWWEMHLNKSSWDYGMTRDENNQWIDSGKAHGRHGATTAHVKDMIDFAADNNLKGVLVEGWNTGWENWIGFEDREGVFDFVTPYPDYNIKEVVAYGKEKGVDIIMHHETSAATETYEKQQDTAYSLMKEMGMHTVKTGYVGKILPKGEYHHGQYMVNQYNQAVEKAAGYQVAINAHEPIKATGLRRTYPNTISREGLRGQEFNAWATDGGNPPEHLSIVAFTRMLAGPIDFTPGIVNIKFDEYKKENQVNTTLAHQLALYVAIYSPIQMAADLPEHYNARPDALQFIKEVGIDWKQTRVLDGAVGDHVTIAREEKLTGNWFLGSITDEQAREVKVNLDFLEESAQYEARMYLDAADAHWDENPTALTTEFKTVTSKDELYLNLAPGGGAAISFIKK
ncbi:glycoside hydrolase family 97 protein [Nonlabens xiamenensis]|uniref:glycoside hydrolase family 97 protein n=1 Tax=Nonlabens xiamenensis TaxID=2341043 RepID=UPI001F0BC7D5|nr:glycoside hydrolase family 97 protein [Nonlabens xiamenensis]